MSTRQLQSPIALIIFNRPDTTEWVFEAIRAAQPTTLLVIADGPRPSHPTDEARCAAARAVIDRVDWPCQVLQNYAEVNMGCGRRVATGLSWVFEQVEEAIILEDDCLPDPTFFRFCNILLDTYRHDAKVMMISGTNELLEWQPTLQSYHFSLHGSVWGWASWRRAWRYYDHDVTQWGQATSKAKVRDVLADDEQFAYRFEIYQRVFKHQEDTWDYQWSFACMLQGGLTVVPARNLVSNLGFGPSATHTTQMLPQRANLFRYPMTFPLRAPAQIEADRAFDRTWFAWQIGGPAIDMIIDQIEKLLQYKRHIQAYCLTEAAIMNRKSQLSKPDVEYLYNLKTQALRALGQ